MSQADTIQATVKGNVSGQVAVGNHILQMGNVNGGVVNNYLSATQTLFKRKARFVNLRPRREKFFLGRQSEVKIIKSALESSKPILIVGVGGIGKTTLLNHVAYLPETREFRDGVIYREASDQGSEDLLQFIFESFYVSKTNIKPTDGQLRQYLHKINALILLDDLKLERDDVRVLLDVLPACSFILTSRERTLWGDQQIISLSGLPADDALKLFERELKRRVRANEKSVVHEICTWLGGHPFSIVQIASWFRENGTPLIEANSWFQNNLSYKKILESMFGALNQTEKSILRALGAVGKTVLPLKHLTPLSKVKNVKKSLKKLKRLRLVQAHSPRFSLPDIVADSLADVLDLSSWEEASIQYFIEWLEQQPSQQQVEEAADVILQVVQKADEKREWAEVIRLGRALEPFIILQKRWQAWADILNLILKAGKALGDRKVGAWALHQLGSRAMCLDLADQANEILTQASNIRQAIGDQHGLTVTQHNLDTLLKPPIPMVTQTGGTPRWLSRGLIGLVTLAVVAALMAGGYKLLPAILPAIVATSTTTNTLTPTVTNTFTPTPSRTPTPTETFTPTSTDTPTQTPTPQNPLVTRDVLCWFGPGSVYEVISSIKSGTQVQLLGRGSISDWLIVENPRYHRPCWIQASNLQIDPAYDVSVLPTFTPPPTPTPTHLTPSYILQETISVPVDGSSVTSSTLLDKGITYRIRASGTFRAGGPAPGFDGLADAEYANFISPPSSLQNNCGGSPSDVDLGIGINDTVDDNNKFPSWGAYDPSHVYTIDFVGQGMSISLKYHDCNYWDNVGSLVVEIFRLK